MFAGLYLITKHWRDVSAVLLRNDCRGALDWVAGSASPRRSGARRLQARIHKLMADRGLHVRSRWVKGHSLRSSTPAWLNNRCDQLAKQGRLLVR